MSGQPGNLAELARIHEAASYDYLKQWVNWLGVGSAAGAIATLSLAERLPDPNHAIRILLPSLWSFAVGVTLASASIFMLAKKLAARADHFVHAHNRAQIEAKIVETPERPASPPRLADELNASRNRLITEQHEFHERAERAWVRQSRWGQVWITCAVISSACFIFGIVWPLVQISLGKTLLP